MNSNETAGRSLSGTSLRAAQLRHRLNAVVRWEAIGAEERSIVQSFLRTKDSRPEGLYGPLLVRLLAAVIEDDGTISLANEHAARSLQRAASWVGTISPPAVVEYDESDSEYLWESGSSAFFRGWMDAYSQGNQPNSLIRGKFAAVPLPAGAKRGSWTFGGMAFGVSKYSQHLKEAVMAVRYLASTEVQRKRARSLGQVPTRTALLSDEGLLASTPFHGSLGKLWKDGMCWRPSNVAGAKYELVSDAYAKAVHDVISGKVGALEALADAQRSLLPLLKRKSNRLCILGCLTNSLESHVLSVSKRDPLRLRLIFSMFRCRADRRLESRAPTQMPLCGPIPKCGNECEGDLSGRLEATPTRFPKRGSAELDGLLEGGACQ